jgi:2,3-bisphosphoglycerate-dependent phosphoglycerate mutase
LGALPGVGAPHATALSTLIHFYDPTFGFEDFMELRPRMPWIAKFTFDGESCVGIEKIDVMGG